MKGLRRVLEQAVAHLSSHPEDTRSADRPATATLEEGLRCRVHGCDGQVLVTDMPSAVSGGGIAPSPGWLLRAAQASCEATVIGMRAAQVGVKLTALEVTADSESDDRGLLGIDDAIPAGPPCSRIRVRIAAEGASGETLRQIVSWAERHSPVSDALRRAVPTSVEIQARQPVG